MFKIFNPWQIPPPYTPIPFIHNITHIILQFQQFSQNTTLTQSTHSFIQIHPFFTHTFYTRFSTHSHIVSYLIQNFKHSHYQHLYLFIHLTHQICSFYPLTIHMPNTPIHTHNKLIHDKQNIAQSIPYHPNIRLTCIWKKYRCSSIPNINTSLTTYTSVYTL